MISAFGVIHKSQISPGVFKPITAAKPLERMKVARRLKENYHEGYGFQQKPGDATGRRLMMRTHEHGVVHNPGGTSPQVVHSSSAPQKEINGETRYKGGTSWPNGKGGGRVEIYQHNVPESQRSMTPEHTLQHEMRHIAPKRNPVTFSQRMKDPFKLGREEGRADFGIPRTKDYPGNPEFRSGYQDVQSRMARAKRRKA